MITILVPDKKKKPETKQEKADTTPVAAAGAPAPESSAT
jgi:hypothetical protein